jgi:hypothetical protein
VIKSARIAVCALFLFPALAAQAANRSTLEWEKPSPVDTRTVFFGEPAVDKKEDPAAPRPGDKSYPWYCVDKGNEHFLNGEYEKAVHFFKAAYAVPGPTRVLSGFRLIDAYDRLNWADSALDVLDEMERKYLVSTREFREAKSLRQGLEDKRRRNLVHKKIEPFTGREWVKQVSEWRLRWVLGAMDELRRHGVPLKEQAHGYTFLLEEYFLANPSAPAQDAVTAFAEFLYGRDPDTRLPIDRWRHLKSSEVGARSSENVLRPPTSELRAKLTGAQWITMTHEDKMEYVQGALAVLKDQRVPMQKDVFAYTDALDILFTSKPELPAADSVVALASLLYETEPQAREILEAIRLK